MAFTVTYSGNGATGGNVPVDGNLYPNNAQVTVLGNTSNLTKAGANFVYWSTAADGSGPLYSGGAQFIINAPVTLYAQWYVSAGLLGGGVTTHYAFSYDSALQTTGANPSGPEPARTNSLIAVAESDFTLMDGWFGGIGLTFSLPVTVYVANQGGGASWGPPILLKPGGGDANLMRDLMVAEVTEMLMLAQKRGWFAPDHTNEQSTGEGLSIFLAQQFELATQRSINPGFTGNSNLWLNNPVTVNGITYPQRFDFVNTTLEYDHSNDPSSGCALLFIYYLFNQLGFSINRIIDAAPTQFVGLPTTLAQVYGNLTGDSGDPFPLFKQLLDAYFSPGTTAQIPGPSPDNPFPLIPIREGTGSSFALSAATDTVEVFWIRPDGMVFTNARNPNLNQGNWNQPINDVASLPGSADPRSGVAVVSTSPGAVEVFWIRPDGMVFTNARNPNINQGNWNQPINNVASLPGSADPRSGVAAVSTSPGAVEVFWIRPDGMVFTNARDPNINQGNWNQPINNVASLPGSADPRSGVAAVSTSHGAVEVFWIRPDGMVFTNARNPGINGGNWNQPINDVAPGLGSADPRSGIAAVSTVPGAVEVFWIRPDGLVLTNARDPNINQGNWNQPIEVGTGADPRSGVAAVSRQFGCVDVFWVSDTGQVMTSARHPFRNAGTFTAAVPIAPDGSAYSSTPVGAVCSFLNAVEVFWIRSDGMVFTNAQNPFINGGNWNQPINSVAPLPGSAATAQR